MTLFRCLKHHPDELARYIDSELWSRESFCIHLSENPASLTDIQRAARYYYLLNVSFGGQGHTYGYSFKNAPTRKFFDTAYFKTVRERLMHTYIESLPYSNLIAKYDREDTFFFLDPPYFETSMSFSPDHSTSFGVTEYQQLADILKSLKGKFILTVGDHPLMRELFSEFEIGCVNVGYSVSRSSAARKEYGELMIRNY